MNDCEHIRQILEDNAQCKAYLRNLAPVLNSIEAQIYLLCEEQHTAVPAALDGSQLDEALVRENERLHQLVRLSQQLLRQMDTLLIFLSDKITNH